MREAALHRPVDWYGFPPYVPLGMRRSIPPKPPPEAVRDDVGASESLVAPEASEASVASVAVPAVLSRCHRLGVGGSGGG
jgi:hypothetical protein